MSAFLLRLSQRLLKPFKEPTSKAVQGRVDISRVALALKYYNRYQESEVDPVQAEVDSFYKEIEALQQYELDKFVQRNITAQVVEIFKDIDNNNHSSHSSESDENRSPFPSRRTAPPSSDVPLPNKLSQPIKFSVVCKESSIENAGDGVFVNLNNITSEDDSVVPGSVICFYPGLVHLKDHLKKNDYLKSLLPDPNFMLMARIDQTIVDGRTAHLTPDNPYALAHKINHCGKDRMPNVVQVAYDFPEDMLNLGEAFPEHLRKYIPNEYAYVAESKRGAQYKIPAPFFHTLEKIQYCMKGVLFIACRHIHDGDEILMDYRLHKPQSTENSESNEISSDRVNNNSSDSSGSSSSSESMSLPSWYASYNEEEAKLRWSEDD